MSFKQVSEYPMELSTTIRRNIPPKQLPGASPLGWVEEASPRWWPRVHQAGACPLLGFLVHLSMLCLLHFLAPSVSSLICYTSWLPVGAMARDRYRADSTEASCAPLWAPVAADLRGGFKSHSLEFLRYNKDSIMPLWSVCAKAKGRICFFQGPHFEVRWTST